MKHDLAGQKLGRWLVKTKAGTKNRKTMWSCVCDCGKEKIVRSTHLLSGKSRSCGCTSSEWNRSHTGKDGANWKGGRRVDEEGYVQLYIPSHPNSKSNGYIREHRVVMEEKLNRFLEKNENVHHINGNKQDNHPNNLELWITSQPPGQRVSDLVNWANQVIEKYGKIVDV